MHYVTVQYGYRYFQGSILDLPLHMVDPRRPALNTPAHLREPGIPPYIPELPLPHENVMNYNQTILGIRGMTILVFVVVP
jgi:ER membrane protein complex subunit 1